MTWIKGGNLIKPIRHDRVNTQNSELFEYVEEELASVFGRKLLRDEISALHEAYILGYFDTILPDAFFLAMGTYEEYLFREESRQLCNQRGIKGFDCGQALFYCSA
jgi:hypothetical protein